MFESCSTNTRAALYAGDQLLAVCPHSGHDAVLAYVNFDTTWNARCTNPYIFSETANVLCKTRSVVGPLSALASHAVADGSHLAPDGPIARHVHSILIFRPVHLVGTRVKQLCAHIRCRNNGWYLLDSR
jgi:hypothetical protein